jgi:hypothetical protein
MHHGDISRRRFLHGVSGAALAGSVGGFGLPLVHAQDAELEPGRVQFTPAIEPIVRLIEETPREEAIEVLAHRIKNGLGYKDFLAALFLAGIRNVSPQPPGFKFHCVFIIHSCHSLAQMGPAEERFIPLFYALDDFKKAQEQDVREGDFVLRETRGAIPEGAKAWDELRAAMDDWDEARADRAITGLARSETPDRLFEGLWEYGARDYRNIGHKIIFAAHAWRTLQQIGFQHAEPTLKSLILGLLDFGKDEVLNEFGYTNQTYFANRDLAARAASKLPAAWSSATPNAAATRELMESLRAGNVQGACDRAAMLVASGACTAQAVWDATHLSAGELMMRQPGIAGVHTVTSANSMHYAFRTARDPQTQFMLMLQGLGWMGQFQRFMLGDSTEGLRIGELQPGEISADRNAAVEQIFDAVSRGAAEAAPLALAFGQRHGEPAAYFDAARHLINRKASEHHMVKWPAAIFEDYAHINAEYRPQLLAASVYYLRGTGHRDSPVLERALAAVGVA